MKERGGGSRGTVNNKLIKTHNRHQRLRDRENESREKHSNKEMEAEKYAAGGKKVPKSVGDLHGVPRLNVNPSKDNVFYDMMAYCDCNWMEDINIGNKL